MDYFNLKLTLDDASEETFTHNVTFEQAREAISEMRDEGFFTMQPSGSNVLFIPFPRVVEIELVPVE